MSCEAGPIILQQPSHQGNAACACFSARSNNTNFQRAQLGLAHSGLTEVRVLCSSARGLRLEHPTRTDAQKSTINVAESELRTREANSVLTVEGGGSTWSWQGGFTLLCLGSDPQSWGGGSGPDWDLTHGEGMRTRRTQNTLYRGDFLTGSSPWRGGGGLLAVVGGSHCVLSGEIQPCQWSHAWRDKAKAKIHKFSNAPSWIRWSRFSAGSSARLSSKEKTRKSSS